MPRIILGKFGQSYGIKGWLRVHSATSPPDNILRYIPWQIEHQGSWRVVEVTGSKLQGKHILVKLAECDTPEQAKNFTNDPIAIEHNQLPALPPGEYYWSDLIGLRVFNQQGVDFGIVDSLFETGSNDVLIITGNRRRLLPYTTAVIQHIDLTHRQILVDWDADF